MFTLHPTLQTDTTLVGNFSLSQLLISRDANYPWFILVPRVEGITEIHHLSAEQRVKLLEESCLLSEAIVDAFSPDKLNVAALGNVVPQLHMHHIARYHNDPAWPTPIWGAVEPVAYTQEDLALRVQMIKAALEGTEFLEAVRE